MKYSILLQAIMLLGFSNLLSQQSDWENPRVFGINKMPGRTTSISYASIEKAMTCDHNESDRIMSLNGDWKFKLVPTPDKAPEAFWNHDMSSWDEISLGTAYQRNNLGSMDL